MSQKEIDHTQHNRSETNQVPTTTHILIRSSDSDNYNDLAASIHKTSGITPQEKTLSEVLAGINDGTLSFDDSTHISITFPGDERRMTQILTSLLIYPILRQGNQHDRCNFPKINILFNGKPPLRITNEIELGFNSAISVADLDFNTTNIEGQKQSVRSESLTDLETINKIFDSISYQTI